MVYTKEFLPRLTNAIKLLENMSTDIINLSFSSNPFDNLAKENNKIRPQDSNARIIKKLNSVCIKELNVIYDDEIMTTKEYYYRTNETVKLFIENINENIKLIKLIATNAKSKTLMSEVAKMMKETTNDGGHALFSTRASSSTSTTPSSKTTSPSM